jgi:rhamnosyltransferase subunit B
MKILISCFGSGGDLFPLLPIADELTAGGDDVTFACPRTLGLYLRALGFSAMGLGRGDEARVLQDDKLFTTVRGGWASWSTTWDHYVAPALIESVAALARSIAATRPDVVVTTSFAAAARIAALKAGLAHVALSMYPQHHRLVGVPGGEPSASFAPHYRQLACALAGPQTIRAHGEALVLWGVDPGGAIMHDRALLGSPALLAGCEVTGFPYWDSERLASTSELTDTLRWLRSSDDPAVIVTQGSFIGQRGIDAWHEAVDAVTTLDVRAVLVGARGRWSNDGRTDPPALRTTGYLPLSQLAPKAQAAIHHGGLGTTFAFVRAGVPAVVRPQAFDQSFNATLVDRARVGIDASNREVTLASQVATVLGPGAPDRSDGDRCSEIQHRLVDAPVAAARLARRIRSAVPG